MAQLRPSTDSGIIGDADTTYLYEKLLQQDDHGGLDKSERRSYKSDRSSLAGSWSPPSRNGEHHFHQNGLNGHGSNGHRDSSASTLDSNGQAVDGACNGSAFFSEARSSLGRRDPSPVHANGQRTSPLEVDGIDEGSAQQPNLLKTGSFIRSSSLNGRDVISSAAALATFHVPRPDVLRAVYAHHALAQGGRVLREGTPLNPAGNVANLSLHWYELSFPVTGLDEFVSHSWRASPFQKIATLMLRYNGKPALIISVVVALLVMLAEACGAFPGMRTKKVDTSHIENSGGQPLPVYETAVWCELAGMLAFLITLSTWRSKKTVFVDKMCINQLDPEMKLMGIESIGVWLKESRGMVLLWDSTYLNRLWCTFELAAFARTHECEVMHVRPVVWGSVCAILMVSSFVCGLYDQLVPDRTGFAVPILDFAKAGSGFKMQGDRLTVWRLIGTVAHAIGFSPALHRLRSYHRALTALTTQLSEFKVSKAGCYCCQVNHVDPVTGELLMCDREAVSICIKKWFHSHHNFELYVHEDLLRHFDKFFGQVGVSYKFAVVACTPVLWAHIDKTGARLRVGHYIEAAKYLFEGLLYWLCLYPLLIQFLAFLAKKSQSKVTPERCCCCCRRKKTDAQATKENQDIVEDEFDPDFDPFAPEKVVRRPTSDCHLSALLDVFASLVLALGMIPCWLFGLWIWNLMVQRSNAELRFEHWLKWLGLNA